MVMAKGKATLGTIGIGAKSVKIVLEISKKDFFRNAKFFGDSPEEVDFVLGDMQMSFSDFDEYQEAAAEDERRKAWLLQTAQPTRLTGTVDASGIVETVTHEDENQTDIADFEGGDPQNEPSEDDQKQEPGEGEQQTGQIEQQSDGSEDAWMLDGGLDASREARQEEAGETAAEPTKEAVEEFILKEKPTFEDIDFDPELLVYKKEKNLTWRDVAAERNITSGQLQAKLDKYKKRVAEVMKRNGAA